MTEISRQALFRALLNKDPREAVPAPAPSGQAAYPLTPFQTAIYLADEFRAGPSSYHIPIGLTIDGALVPELLEEALQRVVARHSILRARFVTKDGKLLQKMGADEAIAWTALDCRDRGQAAIEPWIADFIAAPFDLSRDLPLRAARLEVRDDLHVIVLVIHHIVFDGWSRQLLIDEVVQNYTRLAGGDRTPLPALPVQYFQYAVEQERASATAARQAHRQYMMDLLRRPDVLLATDFKRRDVLEFPCESVRLQIGDDLGEQLKELNRREGTTSFIVLLALFNLLLRARTGRDGIRIACPINCRERAEELGMIGCFVNTLLLKLDTDTNSSFTAYLRDCRSALLGVLPFKNHPTSLAGLERSAASAEEALATYRVMFAFQERPHDAFRGPALRIEPFVLHGARTKCDLTLFLDYDGATASGAVEYRADLFQRSTIERLCVAYQSLVRRALQNPQVLVSELINHAETGAAALARGAADQQAAGRQAAGQQAAGQQVAGQQVAGQQATGQAAGRHVAGQHAARMPRPFVPVPAQVSDWAARAPDRVAVESEEGSLTYAQLERLSNRLCAYLKEQGAGVEDRIGVAVDLGMAAIPAMLAIMKAGAAYVPLDTSLTGSRLQAQVRGSAMRWILCAASDRDELYGARVVRYASVLAAPNASAGPNAGVGSNAGAGPDTSSAVAVQVDPDNLAYIIYTSGSSGVPKGVMITHGGLANYVNWATERYSMDSAPTLMHTSLLSDMTITTVWGPLTAGQRIYVASRSHGIEGLRAALERNDPFAVVKLTPSHLRILGQQWRETARPWCAICVVGGEAFMGADALPWSNAGIRFVNEYGPTETVVGSSIHEIEDPPQGPVPIGFPIANTTLVLMNERLEALPPAVAGEIGIGGAGVARGYENQPAITAAAFLPDDRGSSGSRLYRTGDIADRLADGSLIYMGRGDDQVKIRGYRVELAEVEAALALHPGVRQVAVLVEDHEGFSSLVAHVEPAPGQSVSDQELRAFLARSVPSYMVPHAVRFVDRMPLLPSGKLDRSSLRKTVHAATAPHDAAPHATAPRGTVPLDDELEAQIFAVWSEILGTTAIGPTDNFFEVGGDSVRLYAAYQRMVGLVGEEFPPVALFEYPTIRSCAGYLRSVRAGTHGAAESAPGESNDGSEEREHLLLMAETLRAASDAH